MSSAAVIETAWLAVVAAVHVAVKKHDPKTVSISRDV
jgi:hypothetical protein